MRISFDDSLLFCVSEDACLFVFDVRDKEAGPYTRPLFSSTGAVSDTKYTPKRPLISLNTAYWRRLHTPNDP